MAEVEPGRLLLEDTELDEEQELWREDVDADRAGWYCVATDPFQADRNTLAKFPRAGKSQRYPVETPTCSLRKGDVKSFSQCEWGRESESVKTNTWLRVSTCLMA